MPTSGLSFLSQPLKPGFNLLSFHHPAPVKLLSKKSVVQPSQASPDLSRSFPALHNHIIFVAGSLCVAVVGRWNYVHGTLLGRALVDDDLLQLQLAARALSFNKLSMALSSSSSSGGFLLSSRPLLQSSHQLDGVV